MLNVAQKCAHKKGKYDLWRLIEQIIKYQNQPGILLKAIRTEDMTKMSPEEGLSLLLDTGSSKSQYLMYYNVLMKATK